MLSNRLDVYRIFGKKGQYLNLTLSLSNQFQKENDFNKYQNIYYYNNSSEDSANQNILNDIHNNQYNGKLVYSRPLTNSLRLNMGYAFNRQYGINDKRTYSPNNATGKYTQLDSIYSNKFRSNMISQTPSTGVDYSLDSNKWRLNANIDFNFIRLHHYSFTYHIPFKQQQFFISPNIRLTRK